LVNENLQKGSYIKQADKAGLYEKIMIRRSN